MARRGTGRGAAFVLSAVLSAPAIAGPAVRTADQRQILIDLAHVLGEAHALHRVCAGPADDFWRARMQKLLDAEAPPEALKAKLAESFNAGFAAPDAQAKDCKTAMVLEAGVARRGAALSRRLSESAP